MARKDKEKVTGLTLAEIESETRALARDLAFCARAPVTIQLARGQHLAFTYNADDSKKQHHIPIVMSPDAIKDVRNKEQALKIWRGIGYHELAHHLFPAEAQYKAAQKEGLVELFNLVDDEQNERKGRAMHRHWGACFQAVCAHVFSLKRISADQISTGIVDGGKAAKKPRGMAATKVYIKRFNQFAVHFRRHIPDPADPAVAAALALIPEDFKDLSKEELLNLTGEIHLTFCQGIDLAKEVPQAKPSDGKPEEPEEEEEKKEEEAQEPQPDDKKEPDDKGEDEEDKEGVLARAGWNLQRLLRSKWLYIPFALSVMFWVMVFAQGKISMWVRVAIELSIAFAAITAFLYMRRAYINSLRKRIAEAIKAARSPRGPPTIVPAKKGGLPLFYLLSGLLLAAVAGLGFELRSVLSRIPVQFVELAVAAAILVAMVTFFVIKLRKKRKNDEDEPWGKVTIGGLILGGLCSFGLAVWALMHMGGGSGSGWSLWMIVIPILFAIAAVPAYIVFAGLTKFGTARENGWRRMKRSLRERLENLWERTGWKLLCWLGRLSKSLWGLTVIVVARAWRMFVRIVDFITKCFGRVRWSIQPTLKRLCRNPITRLFILAAPIGMLLVIVRAVLYTAGKTNIWLLIALIVLLLLLLILAFIFRKKVMKFVMSELLQPMPSLMEIAIQPELNMDDEWFVQIDDLQEVQPNQAVLDKLEPKILALAPELRKLLQRCGRQAVDREDQPDGYDLTDEAELALVGETAIFIDDDIEPKTSLHLEVALDCSSSMLSSTQSLKAGEKFLLGQLFQLVVEQACLNLPGVSAHFWGFTDKQIYDCGVPGEGKSSGLVCNGGNNDAAMLWKMGQSAAASGKDVKILMMLSDGQPSECSWLSLKNLVLQFEQEGMIPWNFALDVIDTPAFEKFFTDLVGQSPEEAILTMGETLAAITGSVS